MGEWVFPVSVLAVALALNYVFCWRPMRRGRCMPRSMKPASDAGLDAQLQHARSELERLGGGRDVGTDAGSDSSHPAPGATAPSRNE